MEQRPKHPREMVTNAQGVNLAIFWRGVHEGALRSAAVAQGRVERAVCVLVWLSVFLPVALCLSVPRSRIRLVRG